MAGIISLIPLMLVAIMNLNLVQSQMEPLCTPTTQKPCMVTYTASMPPQMSPVSTVWGRIVTTSLMAVDCDICDVTNFPANPMPQGPFTTKTTISELVITALGCVTKKATVTRRDELHGEAPSTTISNALTTQTPLPYPAEDLRHLHRQRLVKRQSNMTGTISGLSQEASTLLEQLNTALYVIDLINSGANLTATCQSLQDPAVVQAISLIGLNALQASTIVCFASNTGFNFTQTSKVLMVNLAAALYGVEIASNFTGSSDTNVLCNSVNFGTLRAFGVDAAAVRSYICSANNVTTTVFTTTTVNITVPSVGTLTPITVSNSTGPSASGSGIGFPRPTGVGFNSTGPFPTGSGVIFPRPTGAFNSTFSFASGSGGGFPRPTGAFNSTFPMANGSGIGLPGPTGGFNSTGPFVSGSGFGTGIPFSGTAGTAGTAGSPLATGGSSYSNFTILPTGSVAGTAISGTGVYGTAVSGTAVSGTAVSGSAVSGTAYSDNLQINFTSTSYEHSTSSKLPPRPTRYPPYYPPPSVEGGYSQRWCGDDWC